jgi:transcriptional regulator with GAF, ATPase, and Fis domain
VNAFERGIIVQALKEAGGIQTRAAELLGTTRRILAYRMEKLQIPAHPSAG